jgi:ATP-dependent HslUV protease subunit HslV
MNSVRKLVLSQPSVRTFQGAVRSFHATPKAATTIVCVRKNGKVCMMGDGMVSQGSITVKPNAIKIRRIMPKGTSEADKANKGTVVGFAGSTADAFTLLERLESKLDEYPGQLKRSCVELAKGWRTDKYLRRLEASLIVCDANSSLELTGNGDVIESHDGVLGVGSGSPFAIGKRIRRSLHCLLYDCLELVLCRYGICYSSFKLLTF